MVMIKGFALKNIKFIEHDVKPGDEVEITDMFDESSSGIVLRASGWTIIFTEPLIFQECEIKEVCLVNNGFYIRKINGKPYKGDL